MPIDFETTSDPQERELRQTHASFLRAAQIRYGVSLVAGGLVYSLIGHRIGYSTHRRCPDACTRDFDRGPLARSSQSD
jgi:hypothetical protein